MTPDISPAQPRRPRKRWLVVTVRARLVLVAVITVAALIGAVAVNAWPDWQRQDSLRRDSATGRLGGEASLPLFVGAQTERKLTAAYLAHPTAATKEALAKQRRLTDQGIASFKTLSGTTLKTDERQRWEYVQDIYTRLEKLPQTRQGVDARTGTTDAATGYYTDLIARMIAFYQALSAMDDGPLALETRPLVGLFWASDALAQQDTLLAASLPSGGMSSAHRTAFASAFGTQRVMYERWIAPYLPAKEKAQYDAIISSADWKSLLRAEQSVINAPGDGGADLGNIAALRDWDGTYARVSQKVAALNLARTQGLLAHGFQRADEIRAQVLWLVGASLLAIMVITALIIGLLRTVIRRSRQVSEQAMAVAEEHLPAIVTALQHGQPADISILPDQPPLVGDEFTRIESAVHSLARQAADSALTVSQERVGFQRFTAMAATRASGLTRNLLADLDTLQQRYDSDRELVTGLYALEYTATRERRLLENLLVLSGGWLDEGSDRPVYIADIVMSAIGESDGMGRTKDDVRAQAWIQAGAAPELIHLLAELIENAVKFSPKEFPVVIRVSGTSAGIAIEVEDRGQPLQAEHLAGLTARLAYTPLYQELTETDQFGLFVVGRLAQRMGLTVTLRDSPFGGVTAIVLVPWTLHTVAPEDQPAVERPSAPVSHVTGSGLQLRQRAVALEASPPRASAAPAPQPAPEPRGGSGQLPERLPGSHLAAQLRTDTPGSSGPPAHPAAPAPVLDTDLFDALDDIKHTDPGDQR
ncbi:nitrate- and nitrite sensing domain-containing protein [Streptomyces sp. NBC_01433]|uniref:sensor histidine kinase n=1 Tax=Streptomyces sp. NBC_01433 TaxID=2903864 RepID=UPI00225AD4F0|nr:nitrate- and nitrite sensing domain-containing protein [Streptomyces sp. NBC_01433]MCX4682211.1 nitrate- and nitrite sensing domain-containing protein [Streptomyces sp. NBC_01433]